MRSFFTSLVLLASACAHHAELDVRTCHGEDAEGSARILAIGDSMQDFHESCDDVPGQAARQLGRTIESRAVGGATMLEEIPWQYVSGDWDWVLVNGGGNDLECEEQAACLEQLDEVIDTLDGLLETIARDGARIALLGYPDFPDEPRWELAGEEMMTRYAALAAEHDALFIDLRPVIHAGTPELFADEVHPTVEGAEVIGAEIARVLREAGA